MKKYYFISYDLVYVSDPTLYQGNFILKKTDHSYLQKREENKKFKSILYGVSLNQFPTIGIAQLTLSFDFVTTNFKALEDTLTKKFSVLQNIQIEKVRNNQYKYMVHFASGISLRSFEPFDFDKIYKSDTHICTIVLTNSLRKVDI